MKIEYYYHGWRVLEERDGSGNLQRQYTYGNYLDEVWTIDDRDGVTIAQLNNGSGSDRHFAHCNTLYHVYGLTDEDGNLVEAYQYDAYGKATVITDGDDGDGIVNFNSNDVRTSGGWSSMGNPYQYTGQRCDPETGLVYYKNRYYDTALGRFISRDPVGYRNGMNLYLYVNSRTMKYLDPYGLTLIEGDPVPSDPIIPYGGPYGPVGPFGPLGPGPFDPPFVPDPLIDPIVGPINPFGPIDPNPFDPFAPSIYPDSVLYAMSEGCSGRAPEAAKSGAWCADTTVLGVNTGKSGLDCYREVPVLPELFGYGRPGKQCCYKKNGDFAYPSHDKVNPVIGVKPGTGPKGNTCKISLGWTGIRHLAKDLLPYKCSQAKKAFGRALEEKGREGLRPEVYPGTGGPFY